MASSTLHKHYKWELLGLLCCAFFLHQADRAIFGVVLKAVQSDLQLSNNEVGVLGTSLFLAMALMMPAAGYVGDVFNRKWVITCSLAFWSTTTLLTPASRAVLWACSCFRSVATALGEAFYAPAAYPLLAALPQKHSNDRYVASSDIALCGPDGQRCPCRIYRGSLGMAERVLPLRRCRHPARRRLRVSTEERTSRVRRDPRRNKTANLSTRSPWSPPSHADGPPDHGQLHGGCSRLQRLGVLGSLLPPGEIRPFDDARWRARDVLPVYRVHGRSSDRRCRDGPHGFLSSPIPSPVTVRVHVSLCPGHSARRTCQ